MHNDNENCNAEQWRRALEVISLWPDGGSEYGQQKIKAFAKAALANPQPPDDCLQGVSDGY